jgi:hypothetical protein
MRNHQLPIALLKRTAKYVTFRQKHAMQRNSLCRDVSFPLHFRLPGAIDSIASLPPTNTLRALAIFFL